MGPQQREMYQVFQKDIIFDKYLNDVWQFKIKLKKMKVTPTCVFLAIYVLESLLYNLYIIFLEIINRKTKIIYGKNVYNR